MSNLRAFVKEIEQLVAENTELRRRVNALMEMAVLHHFGAPHFSFPAMPAVLSVIADDRVTLGYIAGGDKQTQCYVRISGPANSMHKSKIATSLEHFEALCLELAATAEKEGAS